MTRAPVLAEDVFTPAALDDPHALYARLRAEGPVHHLPGAGLHLVTRHAQVLQVLDDPATYSSNLTALFFAGDDGRPALLDAGGTGATGPDVLATADPPAHTGQRAIVRHAFGRGSVESWRAAVEEIAAPRVAALVARGGGDWMAEVAAPLPVRVIARVLGLPDADADRLTAWSDAGVELFSGHAGADRMLLLGTAMNDFRGYLRDRLDTAAHEPSGGLVDTLVAARARGEVTGDEATAMLLQLVIAGSESTTSLLGSAVRMLAERPGLQDRLRAEPAAVERLVEEALRLESPFRGHFRITTRPAELGGVRLPAGARLMLLWGAANRDPAAHPEPDAFDLDRPAPKGHTAFGRGIHFCLGAHLARLEAVVALRLLLSATRAIALPAGEAPGYLPSLFVRRPAALPIEVRGARTGG
ncbi:cytochrome P450 [Streptomyces sp. NPDC048659]|uniref:cytochrome P450 n=1 Tax=Streptomyces sp. NPDC048659 TaxID=3155489 RepID=UPI003424F882